MEIRIERTIDKVYSLKKLAWAKVEIRYWITSILLIILGTFVATSKWSENGSPYEMQISTIIFGSAIVGYGISYIKIIFDSKKLLFRDLKFKMLNNQKPMYTLILNDEKITSTGPNIHQEFNWSYFLMYKLDKTNIYLTEHTDFFFPTIIIDKSEITNEEYNYIISFLQKQKTLFNKQ